MGGAGASVAMAAAQSTAVELLSLTPLPVNVLLYGSDAIPLLEAALSNPRLDLRTILQVPVTGSWQSFTTGQGSTSAMHQLLAKTGSKARVLDQLPRDCFERELRLPTLLFGSFTRCWMEDSTSARKEVDRSLIGLLGNSTSVYIDDLLLASRLSRYQALSPLATRMVSGLCSPVDPAVEFAISHLCSGAIGPVIHISASLRGNDVPNQLEARAIYQRLPARLSQKTFPALQFRGSPLLRPAITLRGARGHLQIAMYSAQDRRDMLARRLQRFITFACGDSL